MRTRRLPLAAAALATTIALAGCSSGGSTAAETPQGPPAGDITFWSSLSGMADVVEAFNASQDDITVAFEEIPNGANGGYTKLAAAITSGTGPDVVGIEYDRLPSFVAAGQVLPLDDVIGEDVRTAYDDQVENLVTFGDDSYALPYDAPPLTMWYRQDVLDAAGVGVPTTWAEFEDAARAVKAWNPDAYLASYFTNEPPLAPLAWQAGAEWFTAEDDHWNVAIDDAASEKVADFWQRLIDEDLVKKQLGFSDEWTADLGDGTVNGWIGGSWSASGLKTRTEGAGQAGKWIAAAPPSWGDEPSGALSGGTGFAIAEGTDDSPAAAVFLEWLTTTTAAVEARGAVGTAYLAYPGLNDAAASVAPVDYYANDIYAVFDEASADLAPWAWGPSYDLTSTALKDSVTAEPSLSEALQSTQTATVDGLERLGLEVSQ
ncbi:multiple sugar transport system substrate-binding protein [Rathayibacter sp. PhB93]|jgi:multiple sugar transport system substrate-binding protein|uniref:ABC transporter substrate-binding protein n=1 Tax=unclassified Rathayibacter TaxID=2609250 RepID=UPI000F48A335|nr:MULTISPECIES: sugar ABC transporter substrate-binding protein [unclassified Rathayibacter]ROQ05603.1 multiple sugar transport system substrate-binding protein [Rathayibacter sp. PhB93]TDQ12326.1 multiple sugar transport system substrate-binding protein [Rathayibacter sp. PhB1]